MNNLEQMNLINIELVRILHTSNLQLIKAWWRHPSTQFAPTPLEYAIECPDEALIEIFNFVKGSS